MARFTLGGQRQGLVVHGAGDGVQVLFHDASDGSCTAPWRSLAAPVPVGGRLVLDFNRAVDLPFGLIPHATCPRPLTANAITVPVRAGERRFR